MDNKPLITVAEASEYKELLALEKLPQSSQLSYKAIFKSVSSEWEQVKTDITHVNENILKDINEEIKQTDQIEKKLKSSFKSINQHYHKLLKHRRNRQNDEGTSDLFLKYKNDVNELASNIETIENGLDMVIQNMISFDSTSSLDGDSLFNSSIITKRHYPLLYDLIHKNYNKGQNSDKTSKDNSKITTDVTLPASDEDNSPDIEEQQSKLSSLSFSIEKAQNPIPVDEAKNTDNSSRSIINSNVKIKNPTLILPMIKQRAQPSVALDAKPVIARDSYKADTKSIRAPEIT